MSEATIGLIGSVLVAFISLVGVIYSVNKSANKMQQQLQGIAKSKNSAKEETANKRRHMRKRDRYLIVSILAIMSFATAVLVLSNGDHSVPDSLIYGWYAFWATEIYHIAKITINKKKGNNDNDEI